MSKIVEKVVAKLNKSALTVQIKKEVAKLIPNLILLNAENFKKVLDEFFILRDYDLITKQEIIEQLIVADQIRN